MIVIVAEKPSVAREIASFLGAKNTRDGYIEGNGYAITWAVGHLVSLAMPESYSPDLKQWSLNSIPFFPEQFKLTLTKDTGLKKQFYTIKKLMSDEACTEIISGVDGAREGELIFRYILAMTGVKGKPMKRLWNSSRTDAAYTKAFNSIKPLSDYDNLALAAKARSEADWVVGLNGTRAYTVAYSAGGSENLLSVGRCQTPVLAMIVKRDQEIRNFVPEQYWEVYSEYRATKFKYDGDRFLDQEKAQTFIDSLIDDLTVVNVESQNKTEKPPELFDLTTLQRHANVKYKFTAQATLDDLQNLYEKKYVTYPRTDSRHLSEDIYSECEEVLKNLTSLHPGINSLPKPLRKTKNTFDDSKVSDHHAIMPTGIVPTGLSQNEQLIYDLILNRFIMQFCDDCIKAITKVSAMIQEQPFSVSGTSIAQIGWRQWENNTKKDDILPNFDKGESGTQKPFFKDGWTKAPAKYNEASLLGSMETAGKEIDDKELRAMMKGSGIGTAATRGSFVETLLKRKYIIREKNNLSATHKGESLIALIKEETLKSPELTGEWELKLSKIAKGEYDYQKFLKEVKEYTNRIVNSVKNDTSKTIIENPNEKLGNCPLCKSQVVDRGPKLWACSGDECKFVIWKSMASKNLSSKVCKELLNTGKTAKIKGFKSKAGKAFEAALKMDNDKVVFDFPEDNEAKSTEELGSCPLCKSQVVDRGPKLWACSGDECKFVIWKSMASKNLSSKVCKELLNTGKTAKIKGFKSKAGKAFEAALTLKNGKISFDF